MKLEILSPEGKIFSGEIDRATFPGSKGSFTVLENHAALISSLDAGKIVYHIPAETEDRICVVNGGFVEIHNNLLSVCIK